MNVRITDIDGKKPSFVQWDVDRVLYIEGADSQPCLHFANPMLTRAIVVEAEADGSRWSCRVPNIILQTAAPIVISVFVQPDEGKTVLTDWVKVQPKLKPQDYTYEENIGYTNWVVKSAEAQAILDAIEDLRQEIADAAEEADNAADVAGAARDQAVAAADGIDDSIATALAEAKASGEFDGENGEPGAPGPKGDRGDDGISPDVSVTAITGGHRVTIVDADNTYVFDVMDGEDGDPGAKGDPGDDGFSPTVSVTTITGGHRVTITDADGTNVFDVMDGEKGDPGGDNVFWATYNTTTEAEVTAAVTAGKTVLCKISDEIFYLVSKAAIGPSGSAWLFASANQTSMRVTFVSGSYWNSISTKTIPSKTSDLTNDSGFVNASGAAAAAPVQSVNGQTGAVTVSGAAYFPFTISDSAVTPGTGVTPQAIYQAYTAGKAVFAVIVPELEIDEDQILPLTWINELSGESYSIRFDSINNNYSVALIWISDRWVWQSVILYQKPNSGIPKNHLASAVQASLDKADSSIAAPSSPATGAFLVWNGTAWVAQTLATWQAGSY